MRTPSTAPSGRSTRKPRLLFVGSFPDAGRGIVGGNATACRSLMASSFGISFDVILLDSTQRTIPPPPLMVRAGYAIIPVFQFCYLLVRRRPNAVLLFAGAGASFLEKAACTVIARMAGIPSLLWVRGGPFMDKCRSPGFRAIAALLLRAPRLILCQGKRWQDFYARTFGIPADRCPIVENWLENDDLLACSALRSADPATPMRLLFMGWIVEEKGVPELIDALYQLMQDAVDRPWQAIICGDGAARASYQARVAELGLAERVTLPGWITGAERQAVFQACDTFALPSHAEGLPNSMIEAMGAGLAVVATIVGSIPDVITSEENGILIAPRDSAALANVLRRLRDDGFLRRRMGDAARETAATRFGRERAADELRSLVHHVMGYPAPQDAVGAEAQFILATRK